MESPIDTTSPLQHERPTPNIDVKTIEIHSRARILQSKYRVQRLHRDNEALANLLRATDARGHHGTSAGSANAVSTEIIEPWETSQEVQAHAEEIDLRMQHATTDRDRLLILRETRPASAASSPGVEQTS